MKTSFVLFKQKLSNYINLARIKAKSRIMLIRHRIEFEYILSKCPDEDSRQRLKARIESKQRDLEARYARIANYQRQMEAGFLDMIEAVMLVYDDESSDQLKAAEIAEATTLFNSGKSRLLMYSRWMCQLNPGSCAKKWIELVEPLSIDSFNTIDEWRIFVGNLPVC